MLKILIAITWIIFVNLVVIIVATNIAQKMGVDIHYESSIFKITIKKRK